MRRARTTTANPINISVYDAERRESVSFTCYASQPAFEVARIIHNALPLGWRKTSLNDRRHKQR